MAIWCFNVITLCSRHQKHQVFWKTVRNISAFCLFNAYTNRTIWALYILIQSSSPEALLIGYLFKTYDTIHLQQVDRIPHNLHYHLNGPKMSLPSQLVICLLLTADTSRKTVLYHHPFFWYLSIQYIILIQQHLIIQDPLYKSIFFLLLWKNKVPYKTVNNHKLICLSN